MMEFNEAIKHCLEVAEQNEAKALRIGRQYKGTLLDREAKECRECAADHRQLAEWLTELKELREENKVLTSECNRLIKEKGELLKKSEQIPEYKRLLRLAVEDFSNIYDHIFDCDGMCDTCPIHGNRDICDKWVHADEALKLLNDEKINNVE